MLNYNESNDYEYFNGHLSSPYGYTRQDVPPVVICSEEYEEMREIGVRGLIEVPTREQKIGKFKSRTIDIKYVGHAYNQDALDYVKLNWMPESNLFCTFYRNGKGEVKASYKTLTFTIIEHGVVTGYSFGYTYSWSLQMLLEYNPILKIEIEGKEVYSQSFTSCREAFEKAESYLRENKKELLTLKYKESEVNYSAKDIHVATKKKYEVANPYRLAKFQFDAITAMRELSKNIKRICTDEEEYRKWNRCYELNSDRYYNSKGEVNRFTHYNGCPCGDCQG